MTDSADRRSLDLGAPRKAARRSAAPEMQRWVIQTFCDSCRFMDPVTAAGDPDQDGPPVEDGDGRCHRHLLFPTVKGAQLCPEEELGSAARAKSMPFLPPPGFGCVHWDARAGVTVARPAQLADLPDLEARQARWNAGSPEQVQALVRHSDPYGLVSAQVMDRLRFTDGTLFMGLIVGAVTRPALLAAAAALHLEAEPAGTSRAGLSEVGTLDVRGLAVERHDPAVSSQGAR